MSSREQSLWILTYYITKESLLLSKINLLFMCQYCLWENTLSYKMKIDVLVCDKVSNIYKK